MNFKQLRYFTAVVEIGSISGAARTLHISQPPLSAQLHQLEEELGCPLFERGPRRIKLTQPGRLFYERARTILSLCDAAEREVQDAIEGVQGTLRLGAVSSVSSTALIPWLTDFHKTYPRAHLELFEGNTYEILEQLRAGFIEIAIVRTPFVESGLCCLPLQKESLFAVGNARFFAPAPPARIPLSELCTRPLLLYRRWEQVLQERLRAQHQHMSVLCKCDDARTVLYLADQGLGVGIVPKSALSLCKNPETVSCEIDEPSLFSDIVLAYGEAAYLSPISQIFIDYLPKRAALH